MEPLKGKGIALDAQVASYDPTRPSATEKFYIATITVAPFSEAELCEVICNVKESAIWKHLAKYPPCLRGLGVPLLERPAAGPCALPGGGGADDLPLGDQCWSLRPQGVVRLQRPHPWRVVQTCRCAQL